MPRISQDVLAVMFARYTTARKVTKAPATVTAEVKAAVQEAGLKVPTRNTVANWVDKWDENDGHFLVKEKREYFLLPI